MSQGVRIRHMLERLEVVRNDLGLRIGLQLSWLRFHTTVLSAIPFWILFWIGLFLVFIGWLMKKCVRSCRVKLLLVDLFLP